MDTSNSRRYWLDNLRWVTVLSVLVYHVIYFYNNKGVFGGIGGFGDGPQYQDLLMYVLYPWFMPLLFLLAGISAWYALNNAHAQGQPKPGKAWFKSRTRKLLVPATLGLLVFHWMTGYFNTQVAGNVLAAVPQPFKYFLWAVSGIGPLWFIQDLWLFSLVLLLLRAITRGAKPRQSSLWFTNRWVMVAALVLLGDLFWLGEQTLIFSPRPESPDGLWNLYKPLFYIIPFLMGYYYFSSDNVQETLGKAWIPLMVAALVAGGVLVVTTFGQDNTAPRYLASPLNCIYGWLMCLAMMGWFKARFDRTGRFAQYMTRSSFGLYIVHYLVVASLGYMMKLYTQLPPWSIYLLLLVSVLLLSPVLYELLRRIPVVRWAVLGEKRN